MYIIAKFMLYLQISVWRFYVNNGAKNANISSNDMLVVTKLGWMGRKRNAITGIFRFMNIV